MRSSRVVEHEAAAHDLVLEMTGLADEIEEALGVAHHLDAVHDELLILVRLGLGQVERIAADAASAAADAQPQIGGFRRESLLIEDGFHLLSSPFGQLKPHGSLL